MDKIIYQNDQQIYAATTMRDPALPEANNMALHVCINPIDVLQNRKKLAEEIQLPLENWALPWQKHTANIARVTKEDQGKGAFDAASSLLNIDAVYTTEPNVLIGVFTADCVGLLLVDESTPCIAAIHSGWKGTVQAITDKTVTELINKGLLHPETTKAYFSPSLLYSTLEVGMEVVEQLKANQIDMTDCLRLMPNDKAFIDNQGMNIRMLQKHGITQIYPSQYDTKPNACCFSYRRDGKKTGEHFTFGFIKKGLSK